MRQLFILILSTCYVCTNGQADTLTTDKIEFEFLGQNGDGLENVGHDLKLLIHYNQTDNPTFYRLKLYQFQSNAPRSSRTYDLNSTKTKIGHDTAYFSTSKFAPGDKIVLEYFQKPRFSREFTIRSTASSNTKPYYTDIVFVYNGDTINTSDYSLRSPLIAQKSISRNGKVLRVPTHTLTEFSIEFKKTTLIYEIPKTDIVFHKFVTAGYVDNIKAIEKKAQKIEEYSDSITFMEKNKAKKMSSISVFDMFNKRQLTRHFSQEW